MTNPVFYYQHDGEILGPVDSASLRTLAKSGVVGREMLIRQGETGRWVPASAAKGLFQPVDGATQKPPVGQKNKPPKGAPPENPESVGVSLLRIVAGIALGVFWIFAHVGWAIVGLIVTLMGAVALKGTVMGAAAYNPGQPLSDESGHILIFGFFIGVIIAGLAGFPAGLAVVRRPGQRKRLVQWFVGMFATGVLIQIGVFVYLVAAS